MLVFIESNDAADESGGPLNLSTTIFVWIALGMLYNALTHFFLSKRGLCRKLADFDGPFHPCPRRRARFFKCLRRCHRRRQQGKKLPLECSFAKIHMPPPLPFRRRRRRQCRAVDTVSQNTTGDESRTGTEQDTPLATKYPTVRQQKKQNPAVQTPRTSNDLSAKSSQAVPKITPRPSSMPIQIPLLIDLARMQRWPALLERADKRGAKYRDADGLYPLHWACSGGPPAEAVRALLRVYPSAARKVDREGSTALHFASHYGASLAVIETLLQAHPRSIRVQDKFGRTPLYHAVDRAASGAVVRALAEADPAMIIQPCHGRPDPRTRRLCASAGRSPLYLAWAAVLTNQRYRERQAATGKLWDKAQFLLEALYRHHYQKLLSKGGERVLVYRMIHAAIMFDAFMPPQVIRLAIQTYPQQLDEKDEVRGQVPLALAAWSLQATSPRTAEVVKLLLEANPTAAERRDRCGWSPLALSIASGKPLDTVIFPIFQRAPQALGWIDRCTLLPPALLAAVATADDEGRPPVDEEDENSKFCNDPFGLFRGKMLELRNHIQQKQKQQPSRSDKAADRGGYAHLSKEVRQLSTIYELLQADPSVVS